MSRRAARIRRGEISSERKPGVVLVKPSVGDLREAQAAARRYEADWRRELARADAAEAALAHVRAELHQAQLRLALGGSGGSGGSDGGGAGEAPEVTIELLRAENADLKEEVAGLKRRRSCKTAQVANGADAR